MRKLQGHKNNLFSPDHILNGFAFLLDASHGLGRSENRGIVFYLQADRGDI